MLKASNINKIFYKPVQVHLLKDISLTAHLGEAIAIMGTSGVGKTTLLHILSTLEKPDSGTLLINNKLVEDSAKIRNEEIGFIFQSFFLIEHLTVLQNVLMPAVIARKKTSPSSPSYQRALDLLKEVNLYDLRFQQAKNLSGGEKQRTSIARALCNNPTIIFADEPTGNLDQTTSKMIQDLLINTIKKENKTLILVTHDSDFANRCDRVYKLKDGTLTQVDHYDHVFS